MTTVDFDLIARDLPEHRRPDIAAGMLLAWCVIADLVDRVVHVAICDAARAIYDDAEDVYDELVHDPRGDWVDEDQLSEPTED